MLRASTISTIANLPYTTHMWLGLLLLLSTAAAIWHLVASWNRSHRGNRNPQYICFSSTLNLVPWSRLAIESLYYPTMSYHVGVVLSPHSTAVLRREPHQRVSHSLAQFGAGFTTPRFSTPKHLVPLFTWICQTCPLLLLSRSLTSSPQTYLFLLSWRLIVLFLQRVATNCSLSLFNSWPNSQGWKLKS